MMNRWGKLRLGLLALFVVSIYFFLSPWYDYKVLSVSQITVGSYAKWFNYSKDGLNGPQISMEDALLIKKIRSKFLLPPPSPETDYNLAKPEDRDPSMGQSKVILQLFNEKKNGFFIECGALDGETRSNTLYLERDLKWSGLLIEADPLNFESMIKKNRRAYLSPACLSVNPYPEIVTFEQNYNMGKISGNEAKDNTKTYVNVQCFPIYSYFLAMNITDVDYFSLDVEGAELAVLKTVPFEKVNIKVLSVEFAHVPDGKEALKTFMEGKGYRVEEEVTHDNNLANDFIFVKEDAGL